MQRLEAAEVPLSKVFSSDYEFRIPEYQRPYAWGTEQALQLLDDLTEALERDGDEPYFLGSIVLVKASGEPTAEVIDGQQRLTTLTILFAVLRDLVEPGPLSVEIERLLREPGSQLQQLAPRPRLELRPRDREFFTRYVQSAAPIGDLAALRPDALRTDAQAAIQANVVALRQRLQARTSGQLLGLLQLLAQRTFLVVVATPDLASAHRIFSVMNARGLDLAPTDIFKSAVIGALPEPASTVYADKWESVEEELGRDGFVELFLHIRTIESKLRARRELLKEFDEQVLRRFLPDRAAQFVDEVLVPYGAAYECVRDQSYRATSGADRVNGWLKRLVQLDNNDWRPPVLWALRHRGDDPAWLDEFLGRLERLSAAMFICRTYTTPRVQRYIELLSQLTDGAGSDAPALDLTDDERKRTRDLLNADLYLEQKVRKFVLLRLDEELSTGQGAVYDHKIITVEHVLPQTPSRTSGWVQRFDEEERTAWTHRLANLVLLSRSKNSEAQNFDFSTKKQKYFTTASGTSPFALTTGVLQVDEWTREVLEERQARLFDLLCRIWNL